MLNINSVKETTRIISFIRSTLKKQGFSKLILGLSGGVDSATCAFLVSKAIGPENLYILLIPVTHLHCHSWLDQESIKISIDSRSGSQPVENDEVDKFYLPQNQDMSPARKVIQNLKIPKENVFEIDITKAVKTLLTLSLRGMPIPKQSQSDCHAPPDETSGFARNDKKVQNLNPLLKGNIIARTRMIISFDLAKRLPALVCGTENRSEHLLGYFTRFGDEASDIEPIRHLYKTQVYQLAKYLKVPQEIIKATPTAGLWPGQTDEGELGFTYKEADPVLYLLFEKKKKPEEIVASSQQPAAKVKRILKRVKENLFKKKIPYSLL